MVEPRPNVMNQLSVNTVTYITCQNVDFEFVKIFFWPNYDILGQNRVILKNLIFFGFLGTFSVFSGPRTHFLGPKSCFSTIHTI